MNRYRTVPGLTGQSKASSTTICQKCLQKGHYSYECKSSLQSRPYVSRASRSQQLRNPKLKPALTEAKLEEQQNDEHAEQPLKSVNSSLSKTNPDVLSEQSPTEYPTAGRPTKRRRSNSASSVDSVSTISSTASSPKNHRIPSQSISPEHRSKARPSVSRSRSPPRRRRRQFSRSLSPSASNTKQDTRYRRRNSPDGSPPSEDERRGHPAQHLHREERAGRDANRGVSRAGPPRLRSLSPYSRRLALTQSMNADR